MKGMDIAKTFFFEWGYPFLKENFPEIADRMAAGRLGGGSDIIGADDEISQDHQWGPVFTLYLSAEDYAAYGEKIEAEINKAAPADWKGYRVAGAGDKNVYVSSIPGFVQSFGLSKLPISSDEWKSLLEKESDLYFLRRGAVWLDRSGELSDWKKALHHWPEYALTTRLADECFRVWHYGEYNFIRRMATGRDPLSLSICLGEFVSGVMRIVFLVNSDYTPYWKLLSHEFRKQPGAQVYVPMLEQLVRSTDIDRQSQMILEICSNIHRLLLTTGHVSGSDPYPYILPLLNDYYELQSSLKGTGWEKPWVDAFLKRIGK
jgi:hypothetical protein